MTSGRATTSRPGAPPQARPAGSPSPDSPPGPGRRLRPALAAVVAVLLVAGTAAALTSGGSTGPEPAAAAPATSEAFAVTPPSGWTVAPAGAPGLDVFGVPFTRLAEVPPFVAGHCPADATPRGVAAAALVAVPAGTTVGQAAEAFARGAAESAYAGSAPQVAVGPAGPRPGGAGPEGPEGSWVEATVRTDGTTAGAAGCRATDGSVGVLAVPRTQAQDGSTGVAMLVVAADTAGGPGDAVPQQDLTDLAESAVAPAR